MSVSQSSSLFFSAAHKSSGKTVISMGICAALREKDLVVQPFKKGPDYIDPLWLTQAAGQQCINLDFNTQSHDQLKAAFSEYANGANISLIEGNKGLHDGVAVDGSDSNAELAVLLSTPVVLIIDARGTTRGIVPLLLGYQQFDLRVTISGVILNKVAGARHEQKLRSNIEAYTDLSIIGAVPRDNRLQIEERHLGLMPSNEYESTRSILSGLREIIKSTIDLEILYETSANQFLPTNRIEEKAVTDLRIGIPKDQAFGFYYEDDLEQFHKLGAELIPFDTLNDTELPANLDGLFIGGGFPEAYKEALESNVGMRSSIREFISRGGPIYAECGGLMYLGESLSWKGTTSQMVGALPFKVEMQSKPVGRGLVKLRETGLAPWGLINNESGFIKAHEFHYSKIHLLEATNQFAYHVERGWGIDGSSDGLIYKNVLASYSHLRSIDPVNWVHNFVAFVRHVKLSSP